MSKISNYSKTLKVDSELKLVSVITPNFNSEKYIMDTYNSLLTQTYSNWEWIVYDDNSSDNSLGILKEIEKNDSRVSVYFGKISLGPALARNRCIKESKGHYIAFLDADDLWDTKKLDSQIKFMQFNKIPLSYTRYKKIDHNNKVLGFPAIFSLKVSYKDLLLSNVICCSSAIYDVSILGKVYMPTILKRQDYGLWLKVLKLTPFAYGINEVLTCYRVLPNSLSSNKISLIKYHWELFRNHEKLPFWQTVFYITSNIYFNLLKNYKPNYTWRNQSDF